VADGRRRYVKRVRAVEAALRDELVRQGRVVDLITDHRIGAAAQAVTQLELCRAKRSLGEMIPHDVETRWLNTADRLLTKLGIKQPAFLTPAKPKPAPALSSIIDQQAGS
jgi:hypothetical protein